MNDAVDQLSSAASSLLGLTSVVVFLFLIDYAARMLRPVSIVADVGELGLAVIRSVYPAPTGRLHRKDVAAPAWRRKDRGQAGILGVVLAVGPKQLVAAGPGGRWPHRIRSASGGFRRGGRSPVSSVRRRQRHQRTTDLQATVALGIERTMEQDPVLCLPHPGGHCDQGLVGGDQRPDDRRARDRPVAPSAAPGRPAGAARRASCDDDAGRAPC